MLNFFHSVFLEITDLQVANLTAELAKAGKPSGFATLDTNGRLPHNLLAAGYDKYSAYTTWRGSLSTWRLLLPAEVALLQEELAAAETW